MIFDLNLISKKTDFDPTMTDQNEQKAKQKLEEAEKKLKKSTGLLGFLTGGGGGGVSDAAELMIQAANLFKVRVFRP